MNVPTVTPMLSQEALRSTPATPAVPTSTPTTKSTSLDVSIIVPLYNEEESVGPLYDRLMAVLPKLGRSFEIIFINDGSSDGSYAALCRLADADPKVKVINFRRNFGQTAAMSAGFDHARGVVVIPMDADLQNDPIDIPRLLEKIDEGYDIVSGWRKDRKDKETLRIYVSQTANWIISKFTGVNLHDSGCSLKAYRAEVLKGTRLYGEMHRFIPALANLVGAKICEVPVTHHPREFGKSKYGFKRILKVVLDLITVKFLADFSTKPLYMFGGIGVFLFGLAILAGIETIWVKFTQGPAGYVHNNPVILIALFLGTLGINFVVMGLLAELIIRTYHESQDKPIYHVRDLKNF